MKKFLRIGTLIPLILWGCFLILAVVERFSYRAAPHAEPLEAAFDRGAYNLFIGLAVAGIFSAALLFFSVKQLQNPRNRDGKPFRITFSLLSLTNVVLFYGSIFLIFVIHRDGVLVAPLLWLLVAVTNLVLLLVSILKSRKKC